MIPKLEVLQVSTLVSRLTVFWQYFEQFDLHDKDSSWHLSKPKFTCAASNGFTCYNGRIISVWLRAKLDLWLTELNLIGSQPEQNEPSSSIWIIRLERFVEVEISSDLYSNLKLQATLQRLDSISLWLALEHSQVLSWKWNWIIEVISWSRVPFGTLLMKLNAYQVTARFAFKSSGKVAELRPELCPSSLSFR